MKQTKEYKKVLDTTINGEIIEKHAKEGWVVISSSILPNMNNGVTCHVLMERNID